jgi:hypothetical protein
MLTFVDGDSNTEVKKNPVITMYRLYLIYFNYQTYTEFLLSKKSGDDTQL